MAKKSKKGLIITLSVVVVLVIVVYFVFIDKPYMLGKGYGDSFTFKNVNRWTKWTHKLANDERIADANDGLSSEQYVSYSF